MEGSKKIPQHVIEAVNRCTCCGEMIPEGRQVCPSCEAKVQDRDCKGCFGAANNDCEDCQEQRTKASGPLAQGVTGNEYYDYLIHEVQVVCNCPTDKAMAIVSYVNSLGSNPLDFIKKLPEYVGQPHPDADEVLQALENIRGKYGVQRYGICFPEGYANRKERRKQLKEARRAARKTGSK